MRRGWFAAVGVAVILAGCGGQTTVTRTVTREKAPVARVTPKVMPTPLHKPAAPTTATSAAPATTATQDTTTTQGTTTEPGTGPEASYCADGHCLTVHCPPANASEDYICSTSGNPAARAAVASAEPPTCDVVATSLAANRDIIGGQDNCETSSGSYFAVLWYTDPGPANCAKVAPRPTRLVMDDAYLDEPVCAAVASGTGSP